MKLQNLEFIDNSFVELTLSEQTQIAGGSGATWGAGWLLAWQRHSCCWYVVFCRLCSNQSIDDGNFWWI